MMHRCLIKKGCRIIEWFSTVLLSLAVGVKSALILAATGSYKQANCHQLMPVIESSWTPSAADGDLRYFTSRSPQLQVLTKLLTLLHQSGESNVSDRNP